MIFSFTKKWALSVLLIVSVVHFSAIAPEEGMYPLSDLDRAGLSAAGLKISERDIYDPGSVGLVDALVRVGGCSGSFVYPDGLIITNHHCVFSAVQLASTPAQNYLTEGFIAAQKRLEIEAKGLPIRITESYEDVSERVLGAVKEVADPAERLRIIQEQQRLIVREAEATDPSIRAEVSEMFIGKSYVLFRYRTIEDVRLVYVPRQDIGEFGGDHDNWEWPRHTGDFAFVRAYVAPDGSSAPYSENNVPYEPRKHLKVNSQGVDEEDFVFILGYPGRTFRHRPAQYIEYQERYLLPYVSDLNDYMIQRMLEAGENDQTVELKLATRIKRLANVMKNYRGKMQGLRRIDLVENKRNEDRALAEFIHRNPVLKTPYGTLMDEIDELYQQIFTDAKKELWLSQVRNNVLMLQAANVVNEVKIQVEQYADDKTRVRMFEIASSELRDALQQMYDGVYHAQVDAAIFARMLEDANRFDDSHVVKTVEQLNLRDGEAQIVAQKMLQGSLLTNLERFSQEILHSWESFSAYDDELLSFQRMLRDETEAFASEQNRREGVLNRLMGDYVAVKEQFQQRDFVPDANRTLRLTYGYIRGYSPADASYMRPLTTIGGLIEKGTSGHPAYAYPDKIRERWQVKDFGPYVKEDLNDVPVNMLYDMDTTGGNSGSPIMNAYGELIGVNFDRAYEATINDFAWNHSYSRSIGVDIRYVLWVADKVDGAYFILDELGIRY